MISIQEKEKIMPNKSTEPCNMLVKIVAQYEIFTSPELEKIGECSLSLKIVNI